jgi:CubicO group peptidase (beta-lactamase class C family)
MRTYLVLLLLFSSLLSLAQNNPDSLQTGLDSLFKAYDKPGSPGVVVLIVRDRKIAFEKGYGMANLDYDQPVTPITVFDIASVSKQFTGYAISTLIQQGKISPGDDIHKYLPDIPQFSKPITIRNLIHHTSGLRDWPEALHAAGWRWNEAFNYDDIMRMVKQQRELDFDPGSKYQYSNTGYNLLAAIVAKVSGKTFPEWADENIFKPLGMNSTQVLSDYSKTIKHLASSYYMDGDEYHKATDQLTAFGSSSIFTTAEDLARWVIRFKKGLDENDPVYLRMIQTDTLNDKNPNNYAYGLLVETINGVKEISHDGGWAGFATIIDNFPDKNLSIILLANTNNFNPNSAVNAVADLVLKRKGPPQKRGEDLSKQPTIKVDSTLLKKYTGTYQLGQNWFVTFTLENGRLMTQANGEDKFSTESKSDTTLWVPAYNSSVTFTQITDKAGAIVYHGKVSKRITPIKADLSKPGEYTGVYYSRELEISYRIYMDNGKLMVHHMRLGEFDLQPDLAEAGKFGSQVGSLKFYTDTAGKIAGFKLSGGRIRNIVFEKISQP